MKLDSDKLIDKILIDLQSKVGEIDLQSEGQMQQLYDTLLDNGFDVVGANDYILAINNVIVDSLKK